MELGLSGNALKTFARSITCLARIGNEVVLQASPALLTCHTLNSSRSAYQSITLKPDFFDVYSVSGDQVQCSVLLKAICSVLRTPMASTEHLSVVLSDSNSPKVQWTLECFNGMRKTYWLSCNVEPDIQQLSLDRMVLPSSFVVRPRDLNRLLANFQSTLQEITIIATQQPTLNHPNAGDQFEGKAVEFRSYIDPTTENESLLHTQLWIDPKEELVQYAHFRDPVDVTFGVKELKAFLSFCEGCEVDIHIYFDKAGEPILMAPKFGSDDGSISSFDATLVLATMLISQLNVGDSAGPPPTASAGASAQGNTSDHPSDHTRIWSELSGSAAKGGTSAEDRHVRVEGNHQTKEHRTIQRIGEMNISVNKNATGMPDYQGTCSALDTDNAGNPRGDVTGNTLSQRHPRNWVDAVADDDEEDEADMFVQSTPPYS
ncbi:hypothetical protein F511_17149 [Dorcoceras hygrometricum]|uniref:Cell cycle checkpoint control protein RAD9A n=1 Tax=Dorcoceras hygrometricum TaxID=472368 RepID=A0A2Z7CAV0_9LAMI|nr:hypothetical protein F511_17149 [Dorcoceras hygrometricum]